jgi:hypothetical protein
MMADEKEDIHLMHVDGMEFQSLHHCAGMILANPSVYPDSLREPAERYLLDVFRRATRGALQ